MRFRSGAIVGTLAGVSGALGAFLLLGTASPSGTAAQRAVLAAIAVALLLTAWRAGLCGLDVRADAVVVRSFWWSRKVPVSHVAGLAIEPVLRRRFARLVLVTVDGELVPVVYAAWRMATSTLQDVTLRAASAVAYRTGGSATVTDVATASGRLEHPAAFTAVTAVGVLVPVPAITRARGLTNESVEPARTSLLGLETAAMAAAFVLPATVTAVAVFARHVARVSNLDEFELPLPHNLPASLVLMVLLYLTTAVVVPLALVLLARTGQPPRRLGLGRRQLLRDALPAVGLLIGTWATTLVVVLPLSPLLGNNSLSNTQHNTHVPAYFIIYAIVVSATTAVTEEVVVNGYLLTRFAQLGWRPWPSLWVSLALRTSYHAYYGIGLIATVPFGFWATRSFQKHRRLGRPIIAHFLNDAIILTAAVLTS